jgi:undecaprenyl-diphosphatase
MEPFQAIVLGIVQGLTEFLPVSSSGHLVLFQHLFGLTEPALAFDVAVHVGTLAAVLVFFRRDVTAMGKAVCRFTGRWIGRRADPGQIWREEDLRLAALIVIGSIPTAVIGLLFHEIADRLFASVRLVGLALWVTTGLLLATRWSPARQRSVMEFGVLSALAIGTLQGVAIIPGISRSGATIALGLLLGIGRDTAARFSFLLSIPAVCGAALLAARDLAEGAVPAGLVALGTSVSALVGYSALWMLVLIVRRGRMHLFAPYCALVGLAALVL